MRPDVSPHDADAERVVLGSMVRDSETAIPLVAGMGLVANDFYSYANQLVFTRLMDLFNGFGACDLVTLHRDLKRRGELPELCAVNPVLWLCELFDEDAAWDYWLMTTDREKLMDKVEVVLQMSHCRDQIHLANEMLRDARDGITGPRPRLRVWREAMAI